MYIHCHCHTEDPLSHSKCTKVDDSDWIIIIIWMVLLQCQGSLTLRCHYHWILILLLFCYFTFMCEFSRTCSSRVGVICPGPQLLYLMELAIKAGEL